METKPYVSNYRSIMTYAEIAEMLRTTEDAIKRKTRTRAQNNDRFPIPFRHIGRRVVFLRTEIMEWRERIFEYDRKQQASRASLPKGKRRK